MLLQSPADLYRVNRAQLVRVRGGLPPKTAVGDCVQPVNAYSFAPLVATRRRFSKQTMDVSVEEGIPRGFRAMDIGPQTTAMFTVSSWAGLGNR